jgi:hypothetical protein
MQGVREMKFVFQRDKTISSVFGHVIHFSKGVPTHVPPAMYQEVMQVGGVPEEGIDLEPEVSKSGKTEPVDPNERQQQLFAAFEALTIRNRREDFTAGGHPHAKALARELGWQVGNKERDLMWVKFKTADKAE